MKLTALFTISLVVLVCMPCNAGLIDKAKISYYEHKGQNCFGAGDYKGAIASYTKVIELDSKNVLAYVTRGASYANLGKFQEAFNDSDRAIKLDPDTEYATAFITRGAACNNLGKYKQAIKDFNMVLKMNPKNHDAYLGRGASYSHLGDYKKAVEDWKTAAKMGSAMARSILKKEGIKW